MLRREVAQLDDMIALFIVRSNLMKYITTLLGHREQNSIRNISFYDERRRKVWQKFLNKMSNLKVCDSAWYVKKELLRGHPLLNARSSDISEGVSDYSWSLRKS